MSDGMPPVDDESVVGVDARHTDGMYVLPYTGEPVHKSARVVLEKALRNDEPVFVLRAKDFFSVQVVAKYLELIESVGPSNLELQEDVTKILQAFRSWQGTHMGQVRYPD